MRSFLLSALLAAFALTPGCVVEEAEPNTHGHDGGHADGGEIEGGQDSGLTPDQGPETRADALRLTFVSGHLGSYWSCPEEALSMGEPAGARAAGDAPAGAPAAEQGDCAEDQCGVLNCDPAMLRLQVSNEGEATLHGLRVRRLHILMDPPVASEVLGLWLSDQRAAPGPLAPGASEQIHLEFRGVARDRSGAFEADSVGFEVEVELEADEAAPERLVTPEIQPLPEVAT